MKRWMALGGGLALLAGVSGLTPALAGTGRPAGGPGPVSSPIKHVIEIMIENHSFDNLFGSFPGADGIPAGTSR